MYNIKHYFSQAIAELTEMHSENNNKITSGILNTLTSPQVVCKYAGMLFAADQLKHDYEANSARMEYDKSQAKMASVMEELIPNIKHMFASIVDNKLGEKPTNKMKCRINIMYPEVDPLKMASVAEVLRDGLAKNNIGALGTSYLTDDGMGLTAYVACSGAEGEARIKDILHSMNLLEGASIIIIGDKE